MAQNDEYTQLRYEAIHTVQLLVAANNDLVSPDAILHLGMFFGMSPSYFPSAEELAERFHTIYERLAPSYGYETKPETAKAWRDIPADNQNKRLMIATCQEILKGLLHGNI